MSIKKGDRVKIKQEYLDQFEGFYKELSIVTVAAVDGEYFLIVEDDMTEDYHTCEIEEVL